MTTTKTLLGACALILTHSLSLANWQPKVAAELRSDPSAAEWLIELPNTADLSLADSIPDKTMKGNYVMQVLKAQSLTTQAPVLALLAERGLEARSFWVANAIHVQGGSLADLQLIAELPVVDFIHAVQAPDFDMPASQAPASEVTATPRSIDPTSGFEMLPGLELVRAHEVWATGVEGQGAVVGDHDIGVEWTHPALKHNYRGWDAEAETATHDYNWRNAFRSLDPFCGPTEPCDSHDHGTHTTGTMVGEDRERGLRVGMAPQAQWMGCRSLLDPILGLGTLPTYLDCMEWFIAPYPGDDSAAGDPAMAPDVVNNSWGCLEGCPPTILQATNEATKAAGIVQVVSAGNDGSTCSTIAFPLSLYESSFTIGSSTLDDTMSSFSSRGPVLSDLSMRLKPNVVAPGSSIESSVTGGGYGTMSGTSMAGPHVAGLVALMISAEPRLRGQVDTIRDLIQQTAVPIANTQECGGTGAQEIPNNTFGYGRIDAKAAVDAIASLGLDATGSSEPRAAAASLRGGAFGLGTLVLLILAGLRPLASRPRR